MIILSAFFFACMNVSVRLAGDLPSVEKSFFRNLVAAVFAAIVLCKNRTVPKVDKKYWGPLILRCVCGTLGILCNFYAIDHLLVADASILNKLSPFFAIIFSFLLLKEKIRPAQAACVALAFIGCLFVVKPGFQNAALVPALIGVCGGLGAGIAYTMVRVLGTHGVKGPVIVFYFSFFSCLSVVPWMLFHFTPMNMKQLVTLLMAGLFAEVRRARNQGIFVIGIFVGNEEELSVEKRIYGKDFAYIRNISNFSRMVGTFLRRQIDME